MGRPRKQEIELTETERASLSDLVRSRTAPQGLARRARIVLASAAGTSNTAIAREVGLSIPAVGHWRKQFLAHGLAGLYGEQRPGRPRSHDDEAVASLLTTVLQSRPSIGTHWTVRGAAEATGISKSTVQRYWRLFGIQPHRSRSFKLSTDPLFVEGPRHCGALPQPARSRGRPVRRREKPDPGARAHAADPADGAWLCRRRHPRL
jgi:transposase